jgi:YD repeat-containing protein
MTPAVQRNASPFQRGQLTSYTGPEGAVNFSYDATSQLTGATGARSEGYSYDANGNRTMTGYSTGDGNRLTSDGTYTYTYDNEGNLLSKTRISDGQVTEFVWDYRNRLSGVVVKDAGGAVLQETVFTYDVNDRRIGKRVDPDGPGPQAAVQLWTVYDGVSPYAAGSADLKWTLAEAACEQTLEQVARILHVARRAPQSTLFTAKRRHPRLGFIEKSLGLEEGVVLDEAKVRPLAEILRRLLGIPFDLPNHAGDGIPVVGQGAPRPDADVLLVAQQGNDQRVMPVRLRRAMILGRALPIQFAHDPSDRPSLGHVPVEDETHPAGVLFEDDVALARLGVAALAPRFGAWDRFRGVAETVVADAVVLQHAFFLAP